MESHGLFRQSILVVFGVVSLARFPVSLNAKSEVLLSCLLPIKS